MFPPLYHSDHPAPLICMKAIQDDVCRGFADKKHHKYKYTEDRTFSW